MLKNLHGVIEKEAETRSLCAEIVSAPVALRTKLPCQVSFLTRRLLPPDIIPLCHIGFAIICAALFALRC